ncbi:MAG: hypothetical protein ACREJ3_02260 [Polyangiaceae bacterium]
MRGFLQPSVRTLISDPQRAFGAMSRHRRTKLARAAQTTLVKADQWARGEGVSQEIAGALESGVRGLKKK